MLEFFESEFPRHETGGAGGIQGSTCLAEMFFDWARYPAEVERALDHLTELALESSWSRAYSSTAMIVSRRSTSGAKRGHAASPLIEPLPRQDLRSALFDPELLCVSDLLAMADRLDGECEEAYYSAFLCVRPETTTPSFAGTPAPE